MLNPSEPISFMSHQIGKGGAVVAVSIGKAASSNGCSILTADIREQHSRRIHTRRGRVTAVYNLYLKYLALDKYPFALLLATAYFFLCKQSTNGKIGLLPSRS